jgi:hypothetical protein
VQRSKRGAYLEENPDKRTKVEDANAGNDSPDGRVRTHKRTVVQVEQAKDQEHHRTRAQTTSVVVARIKSAQRGAEKMKSQLTMIKWMMK